MDAFSIDRDASSFCIRLSFLTGLRVSNADASKRSRREIVAPVKVSAETKRFAI